MTILKKRLNIRIILFEYYINITIPNWVIVENIITRNVIINWGAAKVDNHTSRDDIFFFHQIRECNIYFIIPNILDLLFSTVLGLPWCENLQRENNAQPPYAWMKIHLSQKCFFWTVWKLELIVTFGKTNYVIKSRWRQTEYQATSFKWDTVQDVVLLQNRKFLQIGSNLISTCSSRPN